MKRAGVDNGAAAKKCLKPNKNKRARQSQCEEDQSKKSTKKTDNIEAKEAK